MPFCTIVEFEWDETFDREGFARTIGGAGGETPSADGRLSQISDYFHPSQAGYRDWTRALLAAIPAATARDLQPDPAA